MARIDTEDDTYGAICCLPISFYFLLGTFVSQIQMKNTLNLKNKFIKSFFPKKVLPILGKTKKIRALRVMCSVNSPQVRGQLSTAN
jgi:hypothetical protein